MISKKILSQTLVSKTIQRILILCVFVIPVCSTHAQNMQVGLSGGITNTIFRASASSFGASEFNALPMPGLSLSVPVFLKISPVLALKTGLVYQQKRFRIEQTDFEIEGVKGKIYYSVGYNVGELPILLSFKPMNDKKYRFEYSAGCVLTYNSPSSTGSGISITSTDQSTSFIMESPMPKWEKTFSPDLYAGISFGKYTNNVRNFQLTLSYQYGLAYLDESGFTTEITSGTTTKKETIEIKPLFSGITFTYTYFPKFLIFKSLK